MGDDDGTSKVGRSDFHKATKALGLEVPEAEIDILFDEWDADCDGFIDINLGNCFAEEDYDGILRDRRPIGCPACGYLHTDDETCFWDDPLPGFPLLRRRSPRSAK